MQTLIEALQEALNTQSENKLEVDGILGKLTHKQLVEFQKGAGIESDGLLGPESRAKLLERF